MQTSDLILLFIMACSTAYAVYFMLLQQKDGSNLLFEVKGIQIKFDEFESVDGVIEAAHLQPLNFRIAFVDYSVHIRL